MVESTTPSPIGLNQLLSIHMRRSRPKFNSSQRSSNDFETARITNNQRIQLPEMQTRSKTRAAAACPALPASRLLSSLPIEILHKIMDYVPKPDLFASRGAGKNFNAAIEAYFALWLRTGPRSLYLFVRVSGCRDHGDLVGARDNGPHLLVRKGMEGGWIRYELAGGLARRHLAYRCGACLSVSGAGICRIGLRLAELAPEEFEEEGDSTFDVVLQPNQHGVEFPEWGSHHDLVRTEYSFHLEDEVFTESEDSLADYTLAAGRLSAAERAMYNHPVDLEDMEDLAIAGAVVHVSEVTLLLPEGLRRWYEAFDARQEGEEWDAVVREPEDEEVGRWSLKRADELVELEHEVEVGQPVVVNPGEIEYEVEEEGGIVF